MSKVTRIKANSVAAPTTKAEAEALLADIGTLQRQVTGIESAMNDELTAVKAKHTEQAEPINAQIEAKFASLQAWAESNRGVLLKGRAKTAKLATGELSWRITPFSAALRNKKQIIEACKQLGLTMFIRQTEDVDKNAMLATEDSRTKAAAISGVTISQREEFVAKPFASEIERVNSVKHEPAKAA